MRNVGRAAGSRSLHHLVGCLHVDFAERPRMPMRSVMPPARGRPEAAGRRVQYPMHVAREKLAGGEGQANNI
jgi:hypothetical protein